MRRTRERAAARPRTRRQPAVPARPGDGRARGVALRGRHPSCALAHRRRGRRRAARRRATRSRTGTATCCRPGIALRPARAPARRPRAAVARAPPPDRRLLHPGVLGRGRGPVQPVDGAAPGPERAADRLDPLRHDPARRRRGAHLEHRAAHRQVVDAGDDRRSTRRPRSPCSPTPRPTPLRARARSSTSCVDCGGDRTNSDFVLDALPETFTRDELDLALQTCATSRLTRGAAVRTIDRFEWIAGCNYAVEFPRVVAPPGARADAARPLREPRHGGRPRSCASPTTTARTDYLGTYTAYDGRASPRSCCARATSAPSRSRGSAAPARGTRGWRSSRARSAAATCAMSRADRESNGDHDVGRPAALGRARARADAARAVGDRAARQLRAADRDRGGLARPHPRRRPDAAVQHRRAAARPRRPHGRARLPAPSRCSPRTTTSVRLRAQRRLLVRRAAARTHARAALRLQRLGHPHRPGRPRPAARRARGLPRAAPRPTRTPHDHAHRPSAEQQPVPLPARAPRRPDAEHLEAARTDKPWGHETLFADGSNGYVGKLIHVLAGRSLSLQLHHRKDETISVVSGEMVVRGTARPRACSSAPRCSRATPCTCRPRSCTASPR